jgi:transcriptional regulator with XRE-family HTH domain
LDDLSNKAERSPNPVDLHVGARVRMRRKFLGMSQEGLAETIELTFQQVQKYERGANRISASKLYEISKALKAPVAYFFEGYGESEGLVGFSESESEQFVHGFLMTTEGIELAEAFPRIKSPKHRRKILDLVRALAEDDA